MGIMEGNASMMTRIFTIALMIDAVVTTIINPNSSSCLFFP
jgi:hypothetical protein